ncbi:MAG: hypothetical protein L3J59_10915 [Methylococcaceae bacterium]|nr:hypothetical protein [Methylococcaceae bacterium]
MKTTLNNFVLVPGITLLKSIFLLSMLFLPKSYAACVREDVTYYLEQGFNNEQIVQLCVRKNTVPEKQSHPSSTTQELQQKPFVPKKEHIQDSVAPTSRDSEAASTYGNFDSKFLSTAVEAHEVEVTEEVIILIRKECFDFGQEDWNEFKERACPKVKYIINRGGLKIVDRDNGIFGMGSTALYISGNIKAEILDLDLFKTKNQEAIQEIIQKNTVKLKISIRPGMSQTKVEGVLLKLGE